MTNTLNKTNIKTTRKSEAKSQLSFGLESVENSIFLYLCSLGNGSIVVCELLRGTQFFKASSSVSFEVFFKTNLYIKLQCI